MWVQLQTSQITVATAYISLAFVGRPDPGPLRSSSSSGDIHRRVPRVEAVPVVIVLLLCRRAVSPKSAKQAVMEELTRMFAYDLIGKDLVCKKDMSYLQL